jgi:uncharacterized membrane protein
VLTLPEIHGLLVHLPVLAVPVVFVLAALRWRGRGGTAVAAAEPWAFAAAAVGSGLAVLSGLTVFQDARTTLRGSAQWLVLIHLGLGLILVTLFGIVGVARWRARDGRHRGVPETLVALTGLVGVVLVVVIGYVGGRMVYVRAVGIQDGGELAQTASGAATVAADLARGQGAVSVGKWAFQDGFGCASCHGTLAQGGRGPGLSGGFQVRRFEHTHGTGLFPASMVTPAMIGALEAWLRTKPSGISPQGDG